MILSGGRRFLVVGHRGAAARAPENTASSLRAGLDACADAIEIDVGLSADGRAVVLHDARLDRTTDGRGAVDRRNWSDLERLDAGSWFAPRFRGEPLLDLDGALAIVRPRTPIVVEIKGQESDPVRVTGRDRRLAAEVVAALRRTGGLEGASVSSSHWALIDHLADRESEVDLALTVRWSERRDPISWARRTRASALHANRRLCSPEFLSRTGSAGLAVIAYTVNGTADARALAAAGADGIFTDDPSRLVRSLRPSEAEPSEGDDLFLGIDQGSGGTRAVLARRDGTVVSSRAARVASQRLRDGSVRLDAEAVAASVARAVIPLLENAPRRPVAAGLAAQRGSVLVWTRKDARPVTPVLSWRTGEGASPPLPPSLDGEEITRRTGLTVRYPYGAFRLARLLRDDPSLARGLRDRTLIAGPLGTFLAARFGLRECAPADPSLGQRLLLLDLHDRSWNRRRTEAFGIPFEGLPPVAPSVAEHGILRLGSRRLPLLALAGDVGAAVRAVSAGDSGTLVLGTGGFVVVPTGRRPRRAPGLLASLLWSDARRGHHAVEGTVHGLAASLLLAAEASGFPGEDLVLLASRAGPAGRAPRVVAAPEGSGTPRWDSTRRFEVEPGDWSREEIVRGVLEGLAAPFGEIGSRLAAAGLLPARFVATGGLSASPHLVTAAAHALGAEVRIDPRPHRTAVGAALLAGDSLAG